MIRMTNSFKNILVLFILLISTKITIGQTSLDSLRLGLPVGINGDEKIVKIELNKEKTLLKIKTDKQDVFYEISSRKQLPADLISFVPKYTALDLKLNLKEPSYNSTVFSENITMDKEFGQSYDSVRFCSSLSVLRKGQELILKNKQNKICSQLLLNGLGNFRLYRCEYYKCDSFYFIIPWNYATIQNSVIVINAGNQKMAEFSGLLLQTTGIDIKPTQSICIETRDAGDFTEHQGDGGFCFDVLTPTKAKTNDRFGCWNPNFLNTELTPFYSADYLFLINPVLVDGKSVKMTVLDSNETIVFSSQMKLDVFKNIYQIQINKQRSNCAISFYESVVKTYEINQNKLIKLNEFPVFEFCRLASLTNGDLIVFNIYEWAAWYSSEVFLIKDYKSITKIKIANFQGLYGYGIFNDHIIIIPDSGNVVTYDLINKQRHVLIEGGQVEDIFAYDQSNSALLYYKASERTIEVYTAKEKKLIYTLYPLIKSNYLIKLPNSPYYMCSRDASKMLYYVTPSLKVIGFEQLDPVYNRPDIVLDSIGRYFGNSDNGMIDEYRKLWEKRIERLGLDKKKLGVGEIAVPSAEIVGADKIAYENKVGGLKIKIKANDQKYPLRRFNVFVNEVPLYGSAGISIAQLKKEVWDTTVSVPLSVGENKIQVSVMNELGLENFKYPTYVNYTPSQELISKTYYIGIGVNEFKESNHNLKYCVKDVTDFAQSFGGFNTDVKLFTNQQVTKENILALKSLLNKTTVNDKVIISCSSHGLLDDSLNFYLAMHDVDFDNPKARGLKYEELENLLDGIPARQKLLLLDACNSGENDKTELLKQELKQKAQSMDSTQLLVARGVIVELEEKNKNNFKKLNELFVNVRNNTGSVIISAAGGQESALEAIQVDGKTIENGAFTFSILECLKQNQGKELKVNTLKQYAEKRVEEITNGKQKPTSRQETMEINWKINE